MRCTLLAVVAATALAIAPSRDNLTASERDGLQGTWKLFSVEVNGKPVSVEKMKTAELVITSERYTFRFEKVFWDFTYRVGPVQKPRAIDLTVVEGPEKGKTFRGIYTLEGDTYTICRHVNPEQERPTEFMTGPDSGLMIVVWKRATP